MSSTSEGFGSAQADGRAGRLGRLAHFTARYRWPVIGAWIVLTLFGGFAAGQLSTRWYQSLAVPGKPAYEASQRTLEGASASASRPPNVVVFHTSGDATKSPAIERRWRARLQASPGALTSSYFSTGSPCTSRATGTRPSRRSIRPGRPRLDKKSGAEKMRAAAAAGLPAGITVNVTGHDPLEEASTHGSGGGSSVLLEAVIGGLGALVILLFVFGTLPAVLMPLVVAVAAILNTFTLVWALTYVTDVSIIVQFLIALVGLGVAIDYALLMIFRFRDELREGNDVESALVETMTHAGRSVIVSGSTVAIGLLAMVVLPLPLLRSMGIGGMLIPARLRARLAHPAAGDARRARRADQQRPGDAAALHRPRPSRGRRLGPLGALRAAAPGRGRGGRPGDRRRARRPRHAAERERGAAEELPRHRHRDRRPRPARRGGDQPGRDEAARRPRRARRRRAARSRRSCAPCRASSARPRRRPGTAGRTRWSRRSPRSTAPPRASRRSSTAPTRASKGTDGTLTGVAAVDRDFLHALFGSFPYVLALVLLLTLILLTRAFRSIVLAVKAVAAEPRSRSPRPSGSSSSSSSRGTAPRSGTSTRPGRSPPGSR